MKDTQDKYYYVVFFKLKIQFSFLIKIFTLHSLQVLLHLSQLMLFTFQQNALEISVYPIKFTLFPWKSTLNMAISAAQNGPTLTFSNSGKSCQILNCSSISFKVYYLVSAIYFDSWQSTNKTLQLLHAYNIRIIQNMWNLSSK